MCLVFQKVQKGKPALWRDADPGFGEAGEGRPAWKLRVESGLLTKELAGAAV